MCGWSGEAGATSENCSHDGAVETALSSRVLAAQSSSWVLV